MYWRVGGSCFSFFHQPVQRELEAGVIQAQAELLQCSLRRMTEFARGRFGFRAVVGNLHLDSDSANLASPVLQQNNQFRGKLAQFGGARGVGGGDAEPAHFQAQYLDGLRQVGRCNRSKVPLQVR